MVDSVVTQAHKVGIVGGEPDVIVSQGQKVIVVTIGSVPSNVSSAHKIIVTDAFEEVNNTRRHVSMTFNP